MTQRKATAQKILMLGVDGMDPSLTRKYVDMGIMPNVKQYIERGACRADLGMLGGHPTVTPPMWTTLATGCYANVHGITGFYRASKTGDNSRVAYNFDSRLCHAEPLWNVTAEAGLKTMVWHWPGSAWPPTSDNPNLMVVDGTSPGSVNMAVATVDKEFVVEASVDTPAVTYLEHGQMAAEMPCVVEDLDLEEAAKGAEESSMDAKIKAGKKTDISDFNTSIDKCSIITRIDQMSTGITELGIDIQKSPIKEASGWAFAPADAKEFTLMFSHGMIRRPALIVKGDSGNYEKVMIYKNKKETEPIAVLELLKMVPQIVDEAIKGTKRFRANRNLRLLTLDPNGESLSIYVSAAMDMDNDSVFHPKRLFKEVTENVGYPTPTSMLGHQEDRLITDCMLANWYVTADWQAKALHHVIESEDLDVVFSHFHAIDLQKTDAVKKGVTDRGEDQA